MVEQSVQTDYHLHPLGRKIMLGSLLLLFVLFFSIAPLFVLPVNLLLARFTSFQITTGIFVRGAIGILFGIVSIAVLLELLFNKIGWYYFEFDMDRYLDFYYRSKIFGELYHLKFNLRDTKIGYIDKLMWIASADPEIRHSILLLPPPEKTEAEFYHSFDKQVDENYFKAKKRVEPLEIHDFEHHYLFSEGKIKKLTPRQFELLTGVGSMYDEGVSDMIGEDILSEDEEDEEVEYYEDEFENRADYHEYVQIMKDAEVVSKIE